jgi:hypothetical protein
VSTFKSQAEPRLLDLSVKENKWVSPYTEGCRLLYVTEEEDQNYMYREVRLRERFIPMYIKVTRNGRSVELTSVSEADFFFVGIVESAYTGSVSVDLGGTAHVGYSLRRDSKTSALYCSVDNYIVGIPRSAMVSYTMATAELHGIDFRSPNSVHTLTSMMQIGAIDARDRKPCDLAKLRGVMLRGFDRSKVTADHHTHYTAKEIACSAMTCRTGEVRILRKLANLGDITEAAMSGFSLWLSTLTDTELGIVCGLPCWDKRTCDSVGKSLKASVRVCKLLQNNCPMSLLSIFEAEVLFNRGIGRLDWDGERKNRVTPDVARLSYEDVFNVAHKILCNGRRERSGEFRNMSWDEYWQLRWQYTPNGSLKSQYKEDLEGMPTDYRLKNKFVGLCTTGDKKLEDWTTREPALHAWTSTKYEWGKERAIYGCDLTNFVITNFAMYECEERLPYNFPIGRRANEHYVSGLLNRTLAGSEPFCFDFEDFNSQHSKSAMKAVLAAYNDVYRDIMSEDQRKAMDWVVESVDKLIVHDNQGTKTTYEATGTLFSGWRLTTFINSVLNAVYVSTITGDSEANSAHNGDDVILGVKSMRDATTMLSNSKKHNIRAQNAKCALAGAAEFLRVDRQSEGSGQYLPRAISTLIHSRIESQPAVQVTESLSANETRLFEFVARGGCEERAIRMRSMYVRRIAQIYDNSYEECMQILGASTVVGGLNVNRQASIEFTVKTGKLKREAKSLKEETLPPESGRAWYGISDFSRAMMRQLNKVSDAVISEVEVSRKITEATRKALSLERRPAVVDRTKHPDKAGIWRELSGLLRHMRKNNTLGVARLAGVRLDLVNTNHDEMELLAIKMAQSKNPMKILSVLV